jgi:hypothetical protein
MALFPLSFTLLDAYGRTTVRSFLISAATFADAQTARDAFVTDYQAVTELSVVESRLTETDLFATVVVGTANRDEGMTISAQLDTPNKKASIQVPGPVRAIRNSDGTIDIDNVLMTNLLANYTSGAITASDGEAVDAFIRATLDK